MLTGIPLLRYFKNKNAYSGAHKGMRYFLEPVKQKEKLPDGTEKETSSLHVTIWPDPWALEKTDPALHIRQEFPLTQEGINAAAQWLADTYAEKQEYWDSRPGILGCDPWTPPAQEQPEPQN